MYRTRYCIITAFSLSLSACHYLQPGPLAKRPLEENKTQALLKKAKQDSKTFTTENAQATIKNTFSNAEIYRGNGQVIANTIKPSTKSQRTGEGKYVLNFENAELAEVIRVILTDTLNKNYTLDPKVSGKVSLRTVKALSTEELLTTLEMVLQINNAVLVKSGNAYLIHPATTAVPANTETHLAGAALPAGFQVRIIPLAYVSAKEMLEVLKPLVSPTSLLKIDTVRNLIMVTGTSEQLENIEQTVNMFDVNMLKGLSFGLFPLANVDPETVDKELSQIFGYGEGGPTEDLFKILPIERLNAILVITPQANYLDQIKTWLARLDKSKTGVSGSVHVYKVQHIKAVDLADILNDIFGQTGTSSASSKSTKPSLAPGLKSKTLSNKTDTTPEADNINASHRSSRSSNSAGFPGIGEIHITPDEINNSLIVVASAADYKTVHGVINEIDIMPLQVHIDASILAVNLGDNLEFGLNWKFDDSLGGNYTGVGILGSLALDSATSGFTYLIRKSRDVQAMLKALSEQKDISVLSSPSLMVLNNQEARIQVGDQVPVRTAQSTNTSGDSTNPIQTSSIEMRETGVMLKVTPRVNASGVVIMEIEQSVDTPSKTKTSTIDSPTILKRSINSSVVVDSEETVVLGGLISEEVEDSRTGIPWLMDLPWVGELFSSTQRSKTRNELVVLITPRVVNDQADARAVTRDYKKQLTGIYNELPAMKARQP
ncbi:hypothetical protein VZ94_10910 [Methylocucumis oryzae]|uniref:General secretion pathway protein GspD n=1 Tax=Methylocucumis oryzae TaxID=1632867 RepID=A0A0F3IIX5_9GAMM|nr:hypothetical protein VZ94_10910 [Methylocucumis oryzae]